jgi:hypothetical protein
MIVEKDFELPEFLGQTSRVTIPRYCHWLAHQGG